MRRVGTFGEVRELREGVVGLVPTMGYLHEGHLALVEAAAAASDVVVVSIFVNPLQFDDPTDLAAYPVDVPRDARLAEAAGADVVFVPDVRTMYPEEPRTVVAVPSLSDRLEGAHRPGHFEGVATVVTKLFAGVQPDLAFFGRKDAQQLVIVERLAADLSFPLRIRGISTVRESDGLALSSRNTRLSPAARADALALSRALFAAADLIEAGERDPGRIEATAVRELAASPEVEVDYVALVGRDDLAPLTVLDRDAFLGVAGRVGGVRLIDNIHLDVRDGQVTVDRGTFLTGPSILYEEGA